MGHLADAKVCDVEDDHAENRSVGAKRAEGRGRPAVSGRTPAARTCRAALAGAPPAETILAEALSALSSFANSRRRANRRPIDDRGSRQGADAP